MHPRVSADAVCALCAYLVSDLAKSITGGTIFIDGGYNVVG